MRTEEREKVMGNKYDVDKISGNQFMEEEERDFFEKYSSAIENQENLIVEQHKLEADSHQADLFLRYLEAFEEEYVVQGALLKCTKCTSKTRKLTYEGNKIESVLVQVEENSRIRINEDRKEKICDKYIPVNVEDCKGGIEEDKKQSANIVSFGNCTEIKDGASLEQLVAEPERRKEIREAIEAGKGTCYCFMKLNDKWENLNLVGEYMTGKFILPCAGVAKVLCSPSYMKFNGKEGINLLSMLFCHYGGGIVTAQESGQLNSCEDIGIKDSTRELIKLLEGDPFITPRINSNGSFTIGYGYDFTQTSDPSTFAKFFYFDENGEIQVKRDLTNQEVDESIDLAAEKKGINTAIEEFVAGTGYGNISKELSINQNQYDALFSYFYSNGAYVFTEEKYNEWKGYQGKYAERAEARKELRDYIVNKNGDYDKKTIEDLFVNSKGANVKYDYEERRRKEAEVFMSD